MKKIRKKLSANSRKHRKKVNFAGMQNARKKDPQKARKKSPKKEDYLKINLPFEEAVKVLTSPKHKK